jgi:tetratricopeptide (TPR) repeat protein
MKRNILLLIIAVITFGSCGDFLDITPKGKVIPKSVVDYKEMLSDHDMFRVSPINQLMLNDEIKIYKDEAGRFFSPEKLINAFCFKDYVYESSSSTDDDWNKLYKQIYVCNVVIENIDNAEGGDEELRSNVKGEALAQRSYAYFMLVNIYAKHYNPESCSTDPGVPLYLVPDINVSRTRSTVKEVYDQIETDLLLAAELLPQHTSYNIHPVKASAWGLLAKLYLYKGDYVKALQFANEALGFNSFLYDYKTLDFQMTAMKFLGLLNYPNNNPLNNAECIWNKAGHDFFIYMIGVYMSDEHKALYDPADRRLYFSVIESSFFGANLHGGVIYNKDMAHRAGVYTPELYLIRAECKVRQGDIPGAIDDLNTLREKRYNAGYTNLSATGLTETSALELVIKERRKELFLDGWRLFDIKRFNLDPRFAKSVTHTYDNVDYTVTPSDNNLVVAIPKKVIEINPDIEQNERDNR